MIVEQVERKVIQSVDLTQRRFRIDDGGLVNILQILRKNMYSNPARIIVQEYANNARDAHTEAGMHDTPIQITCPTHYSPYLKIRDYGLGISPERIDAVFVAYGASTKQHSNEFIGGFGIGAKSAFSYCDAFEVTTVHDGVKYTYAPHIDASNIGEMPLVFQEDTDEPSGTMISIPIEESDIQRVNNHIVLVTEYWDVRPDLIGSLNYSNRKSYFSEDNWSLMEKSSDWRNNEVIYCVEGIPYTFTLPSDDARFDSQMRELANCPFVVKLKTGTVTIASNREELVADNKTLDAVAEILTEINIHFKSHVMESISKCTKIQEMLEMRKMYNRLKLDHMVKSFEWNGLTIQGNFLPVPEALGKVHRIELKPRGNGFQIKIVGTGSQLDFGQGEGRHDGTFVFVTKSNGANTFNKNQLLNAMLIDEDLTKCQLLVLNCEEDAPEVKAIGLDYFDWKSLSGYSTKNMWKVARFGTRSPVSDYYSLSIYDDKIEYEKHFGSVDDLEDGLYLSAYRGRVEADQDLVKSIIMNSSVTVYAIPRKGIPDAQDNPNLTDALEYGMAFVLKAREILESNAEILGVIGGSKYDGFSHKYSLLASRMGGWLSNIALISDWIALERRASNLTSEERKLREQLTKTISHYNVMAPHYGMEHFANTSNITALYNRVKEQFPLLDMYNLGLEYCDTCIRKEVIAEAKKYVTRIQCEMYN